MLDNDPQRAENGKNGQNKGDPTIGADISPQGNRVRPERVRCAQNDSNTGQLEAGCQPRSLNPASGAGRIHTPGHNYRE